MRRYSSNANHFELNISNKEIADEKMHQGQDSIAATLFVNQSMLSTNDHNLKQIVENSQNLKEV